MQGPQVCSDPPLTTQPLPWSIPPFIPSRALFPKGHILLPTLRPASTTLTTPGSLNLASFLFCQSLQQSVHSCPLHPSPPPFETTPALSRPSHTRLPNAPSWGKGPKAASPLLHNLQWLPVALQESTLSSAWLLGPEQFDPNPPDHPHLPCCPHFTPFLQPNGFHYFLSILNTFQPLRSCPLQTLCLEHPLPQPSSPNTCTSHGSAEP